MTKRFSLYNDDCLKVLKQIPDNSVDSIVTDPPYGLRFMGKKWDCDVPSVEIWAECLRVLKPGGHLLAFAGTRTQHRMAVRIEDAGFEIRDMIAWVYGCLSEDTEVLIDGEWVHYSKATCGRLALCYDAEHGTYSWQPVREVVEYEYADTAFRIQSDHTDQIVSRNHRCLVERGGGFAFVLAEALEREARVPVLEDVCDLLCAIPVPHEGAGGAQPLLRTDVRSSPEAGTDSTVCAEGPAGVVRDVRSAGVEAGGVAAENAADLLLKAVQRDGAGESAGAACVEGACGVDSGQHRVGTREDDRPKESGLEGRCDLLQEARHVRSREVCALPAGVHADGEEGRVCDGASTARGEGDRALSIAGGGGSSREPRPAGQPDHQSDAVRVQPGPQVVRGARYTSTTVARVTPFHYTGKVWCLRVPTGAFVARRNGKVFVTGNSGFPKSADVSKAIDKAAGAEREVVGLKRYGDGQTYQGGKAAARTGGGVMGEAAARGPSVETAPATDAARQWQGWGTALKPALEPITVARKPLIGTVAENVLTHGTGALNVDGCRVDGVKGVPASPRRAEQGAAYGDLSKDPGTGSGWDANAGRWPANLIHDGGEFLGEQARFFYCAKASKSDRGTDNTHPTVKPTDLMRYLCRLVTPPGGLVLDPFMGSGSTGKAAMREGFRFTGIELNEGYFDIAVARIKEAKNKNVKLKMKRG